MAALRAPVPLPWMIVTVLSFDMTALSRNCSAVNTASTDSIPLRSISFLASVLSVAPVENDVSTEDTVNADSIVPAEITPSTR